jgi:ubiquitin-activating enzyme E1
LSGKINFTFNDFLSFKEIKGMTELNNCKPRSIKIKNDDIIEIEDTSNFSDYISGSIIYNVKLPEKIKFEYFKEELKTLIKKENNIKIL